MLLKYILTLLLILCVSIRVRSRPETLNKLLWMIEALDDTEDNLSLDEEDSKPISMTRRSPKSLHNFFKGERLPYARKLANCETPEECKKIFGSIVNAVYQGYVKHKKPELVESKVPFKWGRK